MARENDKGPFNAQKEITKYKLDHSTFDLIDVDRFQNTRFSTVIGYMWVWIMIFLSWILLGVDIYTCLNILVFHRWSTDDYKPYAYSVAKWIFTGCIIFQFCLILYHWLWAIHTYRTKNIALVYVNPIAKILYTVRSYNYFCLFHRIGTDNSFDFACFLSYEQLDNALQILGADTPRQVINILTLRYYATDGDISNDIIANIRKIANTNVRLSIILSFMCLSVVIWSIFFFLFVGGMLCYIPVKVKLRHKGFKSLKKYCCKVVNDKVRDLVLKNHRPKNELLERGILDANEITANPLLNDSQSFVNDFSYSALKSRDNDNKKLYESYSLQEMNPFRDKESRGSSSDTLTGGSSNVYGQAVRNYSVDSFNELRNPFEDSRTQLVDDRRDRNESRSRFGSDSRTIGERTIGTRNESVSSLTYDTERQYNDRAPPQPPHPQSTSIERPLAPQRAQTQPFSLHLNHSQTSVHTQPLPQLQRKVPPEDPFTDTLPRSDTSQSLESLTPYPTRGISLYDKNYRKVIRGGDDTPKRMYPLEETDEEKIKGVYPKGDMERELDGSFGEGSDGSMNSEKNAGSAGSGGLVLAESIDTDKSNSRDLLTQTSEYIGSSQITRDEPNFSRDHAIYPIEDHLQSPESKRTNSTLNSTRRGYPTKDIVSDTESLH